MNSVKNISTVLGAILMVCAIQANADETYTCTHGDKQRVITIKYDVAGEPVPCEVHYEKDTGTQRLWRADNLAGYCEEKTAEFVAKQEGWGWSCEKTGETMAQKVSEAAAEVGETAAEEINQAMDKAADTMAK